jgi:hypothetical protein
MNSGNMTTEKQTAKPNEGYREFQIRATAQERVGVREQQCNQRVAGVSIRKRAGMRLTLFSVQD